MSGKKETYKLFNLPWYYFAIFAVVVVVAAYTGTLPKGMSGCFAFMIVLGTILYEIGEKTPIIRSYLGGGAIVVLFGTALLNYFNLLPALTETLEDGTKVYNMACNYDLVGNITSFFQPTGAFLDFYIAALITGSILGMNSTLLKKSGGSLLPCYLWRLDPFICPVYGCGRYYGLRHHQGAAADRAAHHGRRHGRRCSPAVQNF